MIRRTEYEGRPMCDGCVKFYDEVFLVVMGDYFNQIWSYVFCTSCVMRMHTNYEWMERDPSRSVNVTVRGQNIQIYDMLIWGEPINAKNAALFDLPDSAIQR